MTDDLAVPLLIYLLSFAGVWIGSGLAISSVERVSKTLKISSFMVSFLILGLFTSISELSVGINSVLENDPEIYVGNLIGASIVIFTLIIPLLAIIGNNIRISPEFQGFNLPASLVVIALPTILVMDGKLDQSDGLIALALFIFLAISVQSKKGLIEGLREVNAQLGVKVGKEFLRMIFGIAIIFVASRFVVEQTIYFSKLLNITPFFLSLILIGIGTNIPELSFVVRSIFKRNNQIAFGDYVGSASFNTFLLGFLTLLYGKTVILNNSYLISLIFLIFGLVLFYHFAKTKNTVSRKEGFILLLFYAAFLFTEIFLHL